MRGGNWKALAATAATVAALGAAGPAQAGSSAELDAFVVRETIRRDLPRIHRCYQSARRDEPELAGKVSVRFAVVRKGYVQAVQVLENTTGNPAVERCVARVVGGIRFPSRRSGKSVRFTFPFVFVPQD